MFTVNLHIVDMAVVFVYEVGGDEISTNVEDTHLSLSGNNKIGFDEMNTSDFLAVHV
jgi:hypothetical protein